MKNARLIAAGCTAALAAVSTLAFADRFPDNASFTTRGLTPFAIEGLTADAAGNVYTTGRQTDGNKKCPVWKINPANGSRVTVAFIPNRLPDPPPPATPTNATPCNPSGITFDRVGDLYIADAAIEPGANGFVWRVTPHATGCTSDDSTVCPSSIPTAHEFARNVPGTNGLAFDRDGNLWTGDGTTGQGRVWRIQAVGGAVCDPASAAFRCMEVFRIQPMRNSTALGGTVSGDGVGRQARTFPPGTLTITVAPSATSTTVTPAGGQDLVANGLAFTPDGDLYVADTARGAIWKVELDRRGDLKSRIGCDATFNPKTLCLENVFVAHPLLEGTDGIALDRAGNIWNSANERNAIVVVTKRGDVHEVFRNPIDTTTQLRNGGPLEFPTSPVLIGRKFCTSNSDGNRRDNSPNTAGEIRPAGPNVGKISCMDQELEIPGLRLPVH